MRHGLVWDFHTARARDLVVRELWRQRGRTFDGQKLVAGAREMQLAGAKQFHSTWYVPNNIAIVLVGDIAPTEALPVLERELGSWEPVRLPASEHAGVDLEAQAPVRHQIEDAGGPLFHAAWSRPSDAPAELDALAETLAGPHGLLALLAGDVAEFSLERRLQTLWIVARPRPDRTLAETETAFTAAIATIADDRVPEHVWPDALASGELARLDWAISTGALADRIALAYIEHEPWPNVAARLAVPPTRSDVVTAAKWLRAREPVIVHQAPGAPWSVSMRPLPFVVTQTATGRRSEFANALLEDDHTPVEPRFLVAGSHFTERTIGEGRIVSTKDDGPLFRLSWCRTGRCGRRPLAVRCRAREDRGGAPARAADHRAVLDGADADHRGRGRARVAGRVAEARRVARERRARTRRGPRSHRQRPPRSRNAACQQRHADHVAVHLVPTRRTCPRREAAR